MRRLVKVLAAMVVTSGPVIAQDQWWAGGDGYADTGLSSERNTAIPNARTYDDFDVPIRAAVRGAWGNFLLMGFTPQRAYYEIRSGVTQGNGGILHASGEMDVGVWPTGRSTHGTPEYLVRGDFTQPVFLDPGRYWITVAPIGDGKGRCFVSNTPLGRDEGPPADPTPPPMGTPRRNHNSFFDSEYFGYFFSDTKFLLGARGWDFAFGVGPSTGPPVRILPDSFEVTYGKYVRGELFDLYYWDGVRVVEIQQELSPRISAPNAQVVVEGQVPFDEVGFIVLQFASCVTAVPREAVIQRIEFFDFESQRWVIVDETNANAYECLPAPTWATIDTGRFIEPATQRFRAALSWFDRGSGTLNWSSTIDLVNWVVEKR